MSCGYVLSDYEVLGGVDVRTQLRVLDVPLGAKHLAELGPPQKTMQLDPRGSKLKITTALLAQGSLRLKKPFAEPAALDAYVAAGTSTTLVRRLEADAKSLYALYQYGRLHGAVRLRCGFVDELIPAPWVHRDEPKLHDLKIAAFDLGAPLEVVVGSAPDWDEPWSRVRTVGVTRDGHRYALVDAAARSIDELDVQLARLPLRR